eukprot:5451677-Amphidinium_carterae.1
MWTAASCMSCSPAAETPCELQENCFLDANHGKGTGRGSEHCVGCFKGMPSLAKNVRLWDTALSQAIKERPKTTLRENRYQLMTCQCESDVRGKTASLPGSSADLPRHRHRLPTVFHTKSAGC